MAKFTKLEVLNSIHAHGVIPLYYNKDSSVVIKVVETLYNSGIRVFEFTNRGDFAHDIFKELVVKSRKDFPELILGVGSITDGGTASLYLQNGADFIVTPSFKLDIAQVCNRRKVPYLPGCASLTEIGFAEENGCDIVKLFPGSVYGSEFIKAILGPQPWTTIMVTGGVDTTIENLSPWFKAGAKCVGIGSNLITNDIVANNNYGQLSIETKKCLDIIKELKSKIH